MSNPRQPTVRKFNPGVFQSDQDIVDQFVVRTRELDAILELLRENVGSPSCQHTLVVGGRGLGKTMLLARVAAELRAAPELRQTLLPVRFMEESVEVFDIADFWLEALLHLAKECGDGHPGLGREIQTTHADLARRPSGADVAGHAKAALLDASDRLGRRFVIMLENLQGLCEEAHPDFGWHLRESLQSDPEIMLLATATSQFEALGDASAPFFEFFRMVQLKPLNTEECGQLWQAITGERREMIQMRPLEILTGGSPRLLVTVAGFARRRATPRLLEELVSLVDFHTEYFRGNLNALPKTERRVYAALADLWRPSTTRQVANRARSGVRKTSALLGRLMSRGAVKAEGHGRKRLYAVAEPLHCIYYKLSRWRDEAAVVRGLIRFMAAFYGPDEIERIIGSLLADEEVADLETPESADAAVANWNALVARFGMECDPDIQVLVASALTKKAAVLLRTGRGEAAVATCEEALRRYRLGEGEDLRREFAMALELKAMSLNLIGCGREALEACEALARDFGSVSGYHGIPVKWRAMGSRIHALVLEGDVSTAVQVFRKMSEELDVADDEMLRKMVWDTIDLAAAGAPPGVFAEAVADGADDCDELVPLVAALRQLEGRRESVPEECDKVVGDIIRTIDDRRAAR